MWAMLLMLLRWEAAKRSATTADLLKHAGALYPLPLPTEWRRGGYSLEALQSRRLVLKQQSPSVSHRAEGIPAHRPPKNTHRSQRKSISLQTEHSRLCCRHVHWGSASAAVCRRGCAPSSAPEINTQTWATAAFIITARFICWLSCSQAPRRSISSQHGEEQRVEAFVSVLLEHWGFAVMCRQNQHSAWRVDAEKVLGEISTGY